MADAILFDHYTLPKKGTVALSINWSFTIDVTADEARQKVDGWLLDNAVIPCTAQPTTNAHKPTRQSPSISCHHPVKFHRMFFQPPTACILNVPHVQQKQAGEYLAACAAMICNYLNVTVDYARLVRLLEIQQDVGVAFSKIHKLEKLDLTTI